jgi:hypothetical protein
LIEEAAEGVLICRVWIHRWKRDGVAGTGGMLEEFLNAARIG